MEFDDSILSDDPDAMIYHKMEKLIFHLNETNITELISLIDTFFIGQPCAIRSVILVASKLYPNLYELFEKVWYHLPPTYQKFQYHPFIAYLEQKNKKLNDDHITDQFDDQLQSCFLNDDLDSFVFLSSSHEEILSVNELKTAAFYGAVKIFKFLFVNGLSLDKAINNAVIGGNLEICDFFRSQGFKLPLEISIEAHHYNLSNWIIAEYGIDLNDPISTSIKACNTLAYTYFAKAGFKCQTTLALSHACSMNNIAIIKSVLEHKDASFVPIPQIALIAVGNGNLASVKFLYEKGFYLMHPKLLIVAINSGVPDIVKFVLNLYPELLQNTSFPEKNYLILACEFSFFHLIPILIEYGADLKQAIYLTEKSKPEVAKILKKFRTK